MFQKIDVTMFQDYMTKYPNGRTIFESLSTTLSSFNSYVDEINAKFGTLPEQMKALFDSSVLTVDQLQVLKEYYAAQALLLEANYAPRLTSVESQLADMTTKTNSSAINKTMLKLINKYPVKIVCFGDSMTWGYYGSGLQAVNNYPTVLQARLRYIYGYDEITVVNSGLSGGTTQTGINNYNTAVKNHAPDLVIMMWGLNDNATNLSPETYANNLRALVKTMKTDGYECLLMSPTASMGADDEFNLTNIAYAKACKSLASEQNLDFVDMHDEIIKLWKTNAISNTFYSSGGLHFLDYTIVADIVIKERLADKFTAKVKDSDYIAIDSPYILNTVTTFNDFVSTPFKKFYNMSPTKPTEKVQMMIYIDVPNTVLNISALDYTAGGDVVITNFGVDLATVNNYGLVLTANAIKQVTLANMGLYFIEFKATKVVADKTFVLGGFYIKIPPIPTPIIINALTLQNLWVNNGGGFATAQYYKANGLVKVSGLIKGGTMTNGTIIANLPVGYRPAATMLFNVASSDGTNLNLGALQIATNGDITIFINIKATYLILDSISFIAV